MSPANSPPPAQNSRSGTPPKPCPSLSGGKPASARPPGPPAAASSRSCECLDGRYCFTEQKLTVTVRTPSGPLPLKGRIDILISDRPEIPSASVRMFDFKTGRGQAPTLSTLERGNGAQFAAYYLMARDAGAAEAVIGIIKPDERALDVFVRRR